MALFNDGPPSGIEDLTAQDSQLLTVANVEGIDVTQKLALAQNELSMELTALLTRFGYVDQLFWLAPQPQLASVVVTPPLQLWHTARTLELVYKDAFNSQLNDRYAGKRDQFNELAKWAYEKLIQTGLGIATQPVPQAAVPTVATATGSLSAGTYYITMAWVNGDGEEGAAAPAFRITSLANSFSVQPGSAPQTARSWNVYVGLTADSMARQNQSAIAAAQPWLQPNVLSTTGPAPSNGQAPTFLQPIPRTIQRG